MPQHFADDVTQAYVSRSDRDHFRLVLSGGSVRDCYERLAESDIGWEKTSLFWGDERLVSIDHPDSNYLLAKLALIDALAHRNRSLAAVFPMSDVPDNVITATSYATTIANHNPLDVVHLGMGSDGHTASLFPDSDALDEHKALVVDTGDDLHPHQRRTLTFAALQQARHVIFTVMGVQKAAMLRRVFTRGDVPAAQVQAPSVSWILDPAAAGELPPEIHATPCRGHIT